MVANIAVKEQVRIIVLLCDGRRLARQFTIVSDGAYCEVDAKVHAIVLATFNIIDIHEVEWSYV